MRFAVICLALLAIAAIGIAIAEEQPVPDGTIYGHVYDAQTKQPISGVWVYCQETKCSKQLTDSDGYYAIESCFSPSNSYVIECTYGYKSTKKTAKTESNGKVEVNFNINSIEFSDAKPLVEWSRAFEGGMGNSVQQTTDDGYIIAGSTWSYGAGKEDILLIKTNAYGNEQWENTFGGSGNESGEAVQQTSDGGYIIASMTDSYGAGGEDVYLIKTNADGSKLWDKTFGGPNYDAGESVHQTTDGGYIIVGGTESYGTGEDNVYLIKTDGDGKELWHKTFGGPLGEWGRCVQQTSDGGYIITGKTRSYGAGDTDAWLIKTDINGNELWNKTIGGRGSDDGLSVQQTSDGGYILTGWTTSYGIDLETSDYSDFWLVKTDNSGNELWNYTYDGSGSDLDYSIRQTNDGGYIIVGSTAPLGSDKNDDVWLVKTDDNGNKLWDKTLGGSHLDKGLSVQQTNDGGYVITGWTQSCEDCSWRVMLIKLSTDGNQNKGQESLVNQPPHLIDFYQNLYPSPHESGSYPWFYAQVRNPDDDAILYRYYVDGQPMTEWSNKSEWSWGTTDRDIGRHIVEVRIRDSQNAGADSYDDKRSIQYDIYRGEDLYLPEDASECDQKGLDLLYQKFKYDEAIQAFDKAIKLNPSLAEAWQHKGWALESKGDYSEELKCFNEAIRLNPTWAEAWFNKGIALHKLGRYDEAIQALDKALKIDPKYMPALDIKASALKDQGKNDEAINVFDEIIRVDTGEYGAYKDLALDQKGDALKDMGRYEEAIQVFEKIIALNPKNEYRWADKGDALSHLGKYDEAIKSYDEALRINPDDAVAWYNKGKTFKALGQNTEADEAFSKGLELGY